MQGNEPLPPKLDVARLLLNRGSIFVHLDPRVAGVAVPPWLGSQPQLVLQFGLDMPVPIPDLRIDEQGVAGTLAFMRDTYFCEIPWEAVFALVGEEGRGMVWPQSMPQEIAAEVERESDKQGSSGNKLPRLKDPKASTTKRRDSTSQATLSSVPPSPRFRNIVTLPAIQEEDTKRSALPAAELDRGAEAPARTSESQPPSEAEERDERDSTTTKAGRVLPPYLRIIK